MASPSHTIATSLRHRPALALAVLFATVLSILAAVTVVTGAGIDPASAVFYGAAPVLFTGVGAVILARLPGHPVGRIALAIGLLLAVSTLLVLTVALVDPPGPVTVSRRAVSSAPCSAVNSRSRPTKLVSATGRVVMAARSSHAASSPG